MISAQRLRFVLIAIAVLGAAFCAQDAQAKFKILYSFCTQVNCVDGAGPNGLIEDGAGNLYGTTYFGGSGNRGVIFELKRNAKGRYRYKILYSFCSKVHCTDGSLPDSFLIMDTAGNLYGVAAGGGVGSQGEVFELLRGVHGWSLNVLYNFCSQNQCADGAEPEGGLTYAGAMSGTPYDGVSPLFGVTFLGGGPGVGLAYELDSGQGGWSEQIIHSFCGNCGDGYFPQAPLIEDGAGNLYGTTQYGGSGQYGTVFELSPANGAWAETLLYSFCSDAGCADGAEPQNSGLTMDASGKLYGVTPQGGGTCMINGSGGCGVVFEIVPNGNQSQETLLHDFCPSNCRDGATPITTPILDGSGNLFGTTAEGGDLEYHSQGGGTVFELSGQNLQRLHKFCRQANCADGRWPAGSIVHDAAGNIFGATQSGGAYGQGVVYRIAP